MLGATVTMFASRGSANSSSTNEVAATETAPMDASPEPVTCPHVECATHEVGVADAGVDSGSRTIGNPDIRVSSVVTALHDRMRLFDTGALGDEPEMVANSAEDYLSGWIDSLEYAAPDVVAAVSVEFSHELCSGAISDAKMLMYLRYSLHMGARAPEMADGLLCVLRQHSTEDVVLWTALDAYAKAGIAPSEEWQRWASRGTDDRTLRRLGPWSERHRGR